MKIKRLKSIMRPAKFWIDGITYNIGKGSDIASQFKTESNEGKFSTTLRLPNLYYDKLHNDPKFNLAHIKRSKSTEIILPKEGNITISGNNLNEVQSAREELHLMVQAIRETIKPRQFIAIPTLSDEIKDNFTKFKKELLDRKDKIKDLDESVFQKPEKLHITVCVMALLDELEINEAKKLLDEVKTDIISPIFKNKLVKMRLKGLNTMDANNLKKTNILYANASLVDETDDFNMQIIANKIADYFYEKGFMKELKDNVKIHVTLINTKYRKTSTSGRKKWVKRIPIDATKIIEEYNDYDFGTCHLNAIHLSLMSGGDNKSEANGFYTPLSIAKLDDNKTTVAQT